MKIFITGASGFVGGAAARALIKDGHDVMAMSRSSKSDDIIRQWGGKPTRCDLETVTETDIGEADIVLHCAAFVESWGPKDAWYTVNVLGTQKMLDVSQAANVKRFIHIGTEAAIIYGQALNNADESVPLAPDSPYPYCATKAQAEQRVRKANQEGVFETIVLRPRFIWGPGDTTLLPTIEAMAASGEWSWINHGKAETSTTHIDNLVHAINLSLTKGHGGEAYFILDDGTITMKEMITAMAQSRNLSLANKSIPSWMADLVGRLSERIWRLFNFKTEPPLTAHAAMVMSRDCILNGDKALSELGYKPVLSRTDGLIALQNV